MAPRARRLPAEARRHSILEAARRAFSTAGGMNGTTMRAIAESAGISDGAIYRHFKSKNQLFHEAVVEPLRDAVDSIVTASDIDREEPLTPERELELLKNLYRQLISTLGDVLPLLGLVLFGDPTVAARFYHDDLSVVMDRMGAVWGEVEQRHGFELAAPEIAARVVMGVALLVALEARHSPNRFETTNVADRVAEGTCRGFFRGGSSESGHNLVGADAEVAPGDPPMQSPDERSERQWDPGPDQDAMGPILGP